MDDTQVAFIHLLATLPGSEPYTEDPREGSIRVTRNINNAIIVIMDNETMAGVPLLNQDRGTG